MTRRVAPWPTIRRPAQQSAAQAAPAPLALLSSRWRNRNISSCVAALLDYAAEVRPGLGGPAALGGSGLQPGRRGCGRRGRLRSTVDVAVSVWVRDGPRAPQWSRPGCPCAAGSNPGSLPSLQRAPPAQRCPAAALAAARLAAAAECSGSRRRRQRQRQRRQQAWPQGRQLWQVTHGRGAARAAGLAGEGSAV